MLFSFLLLFYSSVCGFSAAYPRQELNKNEEIDPEFFRQQLLSASTAALRKASAYALESKRASLPEMQAIATNMAVECLHRSRELWDASQRMPDPSSADVKRKFGGRIPVSYSLNVADMAMCADPGPQVESKAAGEVTRRRGKTTALLRSLMKKSGERPLEAAIAESSDANEESPRTRSESFNIFSDNVDDHSNENKNELQYMIYDYDDGFEGNLRAPSSIKLEGASLNKMVGVKI